MAKYFSATGKGRQRQQTTADRGRLHPGELVRGVISDYNAARLTYTVSMRGQHVGDVVDVSGISMGLLGFKQTNRFPPGTGVLVLYGNPCWIISTHAEDPPDLDSYLSRTMTGKGIMDAIVRLNPQPGAIPSHSAPCDLFESEFEITNMVGTFIRFLTFMSSLGSGERAKIEFHLLRDLVRIVSRNFEHFSAAGDFKIFDDGRLNTEFHGTTYEHERWGRKSPSDPKFEAPDTGMPEVDPMETGRWRYDFILGFVGDLFNSWFSDPVDAVGRMAADALRAGKARLHIGQDGVLLAQSCSEIVLEKVVRTQVPIRIRHEEDPEGVLRRELDTLDKEFLKVWDPGGVENEHHSLFKAREYFRYLNQYHSLARLHQQTKDWKVPSESETPAPAVGAGEEDRTAANPGKLTYWKASYATIRIFRDGSILLFDSYANATAMGPYGIQHSSSRHYQVFAAGDFIVKAGGNICMSALRNIELVASRGSFIAKARTGWRALCEVGTLWLKSDCDPANTYTPEEGFPEADVQDRQGIRLQATKAEARWISRLKSRFTVKQADQQLELDVKGGLQVQTQKEVKLTAYSLAMAIVERVSVKASYWDNWIPGGWSLDRVCRLRRGISYINRIKTDGLQSLGSIAGPRRLGAPTPSSRGSLRPHTNHIDLFEPEGEEAIMDTALEAPEAILPLAAENNGFSWRLLPISEYVWSNAGYAVGKTDIDLIEPLTQQSLRLENPEGYQVWSGMADALRTAEQTVGDTPWPGPSGKWLQHNPSGPSLNAPTARGASSFNANTQTALTSTTPSFRFLTKS